MIQITHDEKQNLRLILAGVVLHGMVSRQDGPWDASSNAPLAVKTADALIDALGIKEKLDKSSSR